MTVWQLSLIFLSLCILFVLSCKFALICAQANVVTKHAWHLFLYEVFVKGFGLLFAVACLFGSGLGAIMVLADIICMVAK